MENTLTNTIASSNICYDAVIQNLSKQISESATALSETSKEKYDKKISLIETAKDMTTKEKLDAMDQCYNRRLQETWQNILLFAGISIAVISLAVESPITIKSKL